MYVYNQNYKSLFFEWMVQKARKYNQTLEFIKKLPITEIDGYPYYVVEKENLIISKTKMGSWRFEDPNHQFSLIFNPKCFTILIEIGNYKRRIDFDGLEKMNFLEVTLSGIDNSGSCIKFDTPKSAPEVRKRPNSRAIKGCTESSKRSN